MGILCIHYKLAWLPRKAFYLATFFSIQQSHSTRATIPREGDDREAKARVRGGLAKAPQTGGALA